MGGITRVTERNPDDYKHFIRALRESIKKNEIEVNEAFNGFLQSNPETKEIKARRLELETRVVRKGEVSPERTEEIRELFPSGNYLVHGTSVEGALSIAGDSDGAIKSVAEIHKSNEKFKGKGGFVGILLVIMVSVRCQELGDI